MAYISTIERFGIQKGLQKGLQQGFEQGLQKGKQEGEYMLLLKLLQRKFHVLPAVYCQKLEKADAETLLKWGERLLDADALEEIFQD